MSEHVQPEPEPAIPRRYLDVAGVAAYFGDTEKAIYQKVARRQIPFRRDLRKLYFDVKELDEFIHALEGVTVAQALERRAKNSS